MLKVAIVGSNGFIGSYLANELYKEKDISLFLFGKKETNESVVNCPYQKIDFSNTTLTRQQFEDFDIVYYLASATIPSSSWDNPSLELEHNLFPFIQFMESISSSHIKKIIFISSAGTIYGSSSNKVAEDYVKNPFSPYGIIKLTIEHFLNYFKLKNNINYDIYRVTNVYGYGQNTSKGLGIINTFLEQIIYNKKINVFGDGTNIRNYIHVNDVAKLLSYSIKSDFITSNILNLGSKESISINDLIKIIENTIDQSFEVNYVEKRSSDNTVIDIDNSKLLSLVPNYTFIKLEQGILDLYKKLKSNN